ncbi:MAG: hypothetical protein UT34_C0001G0467 [candidate division WS6 bacterium GW2011_GWF2_39_15]|uniref:Uncharacterized protein n=1 Tax=candidate division WS6 bacterium GW2011_GWF2_39_15 TaxID=1619100 RepID=A0A0G0QXQ2_9BACT|nr:MAG: hypothetical protein UT34_C0001G0467 [candidate division WS6 bacterium GW2011_GWF2_39_15]
MGQNGDFSNKKVFLVNGKPRAGKDTFGIAVKRELGVYSINFRHLSSITPIKQTLLSEEKHDRVLLPDSVYPWLRSIKDSIPDLVGRDWDGETKDNFWRWAMSELKHKIVERDSDFLYLWILRMINETPDPAVVFVDAREPWFINGFWGYEKKMAGFTGGLQGGNVLVLSDSYDHSIANPSDDAVFDLEYDWYVDNYRDLRHGFRAHQIQNEAFLFIHSELVKARDMSSKLERRF